MRLVVAFLLVACGSADKAPAPERKERPKPADPFKADRERMVELIASRGVGDERVLEAMRGVPRHELVPTAVRDQAYDDRALPIGFDKTISQPFIVATMTAAAKLRAGDRVLEIGTGSGYQAAVLAEMGADVYTIEIVEPLAKRAEDNLARIGYQIHVRAGDGLGGWPDVAPFDAILVTAAARTVPPKLYEQLAAGGRIVIPLGDDEEQQLSVVTKLPDGIGTEKLMPVLFGKLIDGSESP